jgi:RNA polymerase sigma-70 factor (ECF subfamily)
LLARLAGGDSTALDELFRRYRSTAYRVAYRLLGNEADALDAVQDGFVKALTRLGSFQGRSSFKTWLLRVVTNAALDMGRQRHRRNKLRLVLPESAQLDDYQPASAEDPSHGLEREDLRRLLDGALASLSDAHRQTFILHADADLSYREVAEVLGISIGTVMSRLFYARQRLKAYLEKHGPRD